MLELKELYKTFNPGTINAKTALNGLSLTLNDGDFVTVIGVPPDHEGLDALRRPAPGAHAADGNAQAPQAAAAR